MPEAIFDLTEAIRLYQNYAAAYVGRSGAYLVHKDYDLALADAEMRLGLCRMMRLVTVLCAAYGGKKDLSRAIADATRAIELDPKCTDAYLNRVHSYALSRPVRRRDRYCNRAIVLDPKRANSYFGARSKVQYAIGEFDKAIAYCDTGIQPGSTSAEILLVRGSRNRMRGVVDRAIDDDTPAIRLDPKFALAYYNRGGTLYDIREYDKAIADFTEAIAIDPKFPDGFLGAWQCIRQELRSLRRRLTSPRRRNLGLLGSSWRGVGVGAESGRVRGGAVG